MNTTWFMFLGIIVFVFLVGLFGAYKNSHDKR